MNKIISEEECSEAYNRIKNTKNILEAVVLGSVYIENKIDLYICKNLNRSKYLFDGYFLSYNLKLKIALSLGFIKNGNNIWEDFIPYYIKIGQLRNRFVHNLNYKLIEEDKRVFDWANKFFSEAGLIRPTIENLGELEYIKRAMTILMSFADFFSN